MVVTAVCLLGGAEEKGGIGSNLGITPQENAQLLHRDEILGDIRECYTQDAPANSKCWVCRGSCCRGRGRQQSPGVFCVYTLDFHGVFGMGAGRRMLKSNCLVGTSLLGRALCLPWEKEGTGFCRWLGFGGCGVGGRDLSEPSMLHGRKGQKFLTGKIPHGPEMAPVFHLFHLSHSWFGSSWEELNLHQLPEPGVGGSPLIQGSLAWGATGTGLLLCPPTHLSGQHADLRLFSQENKALVTLGWLSGVVSAWGTFGQERCAGRAGASGPFQGAGMGPCLEFGSWLPARGG